MLLSEKYLSLYKLFALECNAIEFKYICSCFPSLYNLDNYEILNNYLKL